MEAERLQAEKRDIEHQFDKDRDELVTRCAQLEMAIEELQVRTIIPCPASVAQRVFDSWPRAPGFDPRFGQLFFSLDKEINRQC